jgi:hypothetical protein
VAELHPFIDVFGDDDLDVVCGYWESGTFPAGGTYADPRAELESNTTAERNATIGEVVTAVASAGLVVRRLAEHDTTVYARWPWLEHDGAGVYHLPADRPRLPLVWTLLAERPAGGRPSERPH